MRLEDASPPGPVDRAWRLALRTIFLGLRLAWRLRPVPAQGVGVVVRQGELVLAVRQSYQPGLGVPGGGIDRGEAPRDAAVRELREEVGLVVPPAELVTLGTLRFTQFNRDVTVAMFEWRPPALPRPRIDRREIVWAGYLTAADAGSNLAAPLAVAFDRLDLTDRTLIGVEWTKVNSQAK